MHWDRCQHGWEEIWRKKDAGTGRIVTGTAQFQAFATKDSHYQIADKHSGTLHCCSYGWADDGGIGCSEMMVVLMWAASGMMVCIWWHQYMHCTCSRYQAGMQDICSTCLHKLHATVQHCKESVESMGKENEKIETYSLQRFFGMFSFSLSSKLVCNNRGRTLYVWMEARLGG